MLRETEDELRGYHQRVTSMQRTTSNDSLYDSLASELEASDSGCYNTPLFRPGVNRNNRLQTL